MIASSTLQPTASHHTSNRDLLVVDRLRKIYQSANGPVEAIRDLTFTIYEGEFVCIVGPSGAGKTTLLRCISGLLSPTSGTVRLASQIVTEPPLGMGVVFQEYSRSLLPWKTIEQNVGLPLRVAGVGAAERAARVQEVLEAVGLGHTGSRFPWQLSGGMQQRIAIARALVCKPQLLLMDEPFAAVDAHTRAELEDLVRKLWRETGTTVLFITHDIDESVYLAERVLILSKAPTVISEDVKIDLPQERDQLATHTLPRFVELRTQILRAVRSV